MNSLPRVSLPLDRVQVSPADSSLLVDSSCAGMYFGHIWLIFCAPNTPSTYSLRSSLAVTGEAAFGEGHHGRVTCSSFDLDFGSVVPQIGEVGVLSGCSLGSPYFFDPLLPRSLGCWYTATVDRNPLWGRGRLRRSSVGGYASGLVFQ